MSIVFFTIQSWYPRLHDFHIGNLIIIIRFCIKPQYMKQIEPKIQSDIDLRLGHFTYYLKFITHKHNNHNDMPIYVLWVSYITEAIRIVHMLYFYLYYLFIFIFLITGMALASSATLPRHALDLHVGRQHNIILNKFIPNYNRHYCRYPVKNYNVVCCVKCK